MNNRLNHSLRASAGTAVCMALLALAGCRHPCGYVGTRSVIVADQGGERVALTSGSETIRLARPVTAEDPLLELVAEEQEVTFGPGRRDTYGYRSYVPYTWYAPILKPVAAVTVIVPLWMPFRDPHSHGGGNWRLRDYGRDVIAWFNIFSGVPAGQRKIETGERLIKSRRGEFPVAQRNVPASGRTVILISDDKELARGVSDAQGVVRFDLAERLRPEMAGADQLLRLKLQRGNGTEEVFTYSLNKEIAAAWLKARSAP